MTFMKLNILTNKTKYMYMYIYKNLFHLFYGLKLNHNCINLYIRSNNLQYIITFLKYNSISQLSSLNDIVAVDKFINFKHRFEITYVLWNITYEYKVNIKLFLQNQNTVISLNNLYSSSVWLEREVWDMFGIRFLFHIDLRNILTDYGFKGSPLRKDFPLLGYCDLYYDDAIQLIKFNPIEIAQNLRFF